MAVIGEVHPDRMLTNGGACAGDLLVLTKPLGTGILATALKRDALLETGMADAVRSMTTLNASTSSVSARAPCSPDSPSGISREARTAPSPSPTLPSS